MYFETEVVPVLTKSGCNSAACHGVAADSAFRCWGAILERPRRLVYEFEGRRVNLKQPEKSLILRKRGFLADARSMIKLPIEAHDSLIFLDAQ